MLLTLKQSIGTIILVLALNEKIWTEENQLLGPLTVRVLAKFYNSQRVIHIDIICLDVIHYSFIHSFTPVPSPENRGNKRDIASISYGPHEFYREQLILYSWRRPPMASCIPKSSCVRNSITEVI